MNRLMICDTCAALGEPAAGAVWAENLRDLVGPNWIIETTSCMNMCANPISFAVQGPEKATYLFSGADPERDTENMLALLKIYETSTNGWIVDARPIGALRQCLVGRVPAF